jgi:hypothetical protein
MDFIYGVNGESLKNQSNYGWHGGSPKDVLKTFNKKSNTIFTFT